VLQRSSTHETAIWYLDVNVLIEGDAGPTLPPVWTLVGTADFNGDGHADYVLFKPATDQTSDRVFVKANPSPGWTLGAQRSSTATANPDYLIYDVNAQQTGIYYLDNNFPRQRRIVAKILFQLGEQNPKGAKRRVVRLRSL